MVVLGIGALVYKGLSDATLYFRNADEAVAQRDELGTSGSACRAPWSASRLEGDERHLRRWRTTACRSTVAHTGTPPELFRPGIPVVLEGHWVDGSDVFAGDRILVKHDESYESQEDYEERIAEAEQGGATGRDGRGDRTATTAEAAGQQWRAGLRSAG